MGGFFESEEEFDEYFIPVDSDHVIILLLYSSKDGMVTFDDFKRFMLN
jgi:hypothetical protein